MDLSKLYSDNNFNLPLSNSDIKNIWKYYIKYAKGAGRNRVSRLKMLYYEITINNIHLLGSRPFYTRMKEISNINLKGKKILDIGSNIGLIGIFLIYYHGVSHVTFVEHDKACCKIITDLAKLLKISDKIEIKNVDFNKMNLDTELGYNYDFVIMLSSFKYFDNRKKAMNYFENFKSILFEGDDKKYENDFDNFFIEKEFNIKKIGRINDA